MDGLTDADQKKMQAAQTLIRERRYTEARALLVTIDHPRATDWILRIDGILAAEPRPVVDNPNMWRRIMLLLIVVGIVAAIGYGLHAKYIQDEETGSRAFCNMIYLPQSDAWLKCMNEP